MKKVTFSLPVQALGNATEAILLGDFNNWNPSEAMILSPHPDGTLSADLLLEPGKTYEYRFLLNDGTWVNDWAAQGYIYKPDLDVENSVITVPHEMVVVEETVVIVAKEPVITGNKTVVKKVAPKKAKTITSNTAKKTNEISSNDNLATIEGIGPKIVKLLNAAGITTYKDLARATNKKLKAILDAGGSAFKRHSPENWSKQAKLAAAGKWEELKKMQEELTGRK